MNELINILNYLSHSSTISVIARLVLAVLLGGFVGLERSKSGRAAGLRTHIIVCVGATIAAMTGLYICEKYGGDVGRIAAQVISGIGFLGAGTILVKNHSKVTGLTTAACVWGVGTIGVAIGYGFYLAAIFGAMLIFLMTTTLNRIDRKVRPNSKVYDVYIELVDSTHVNSTLSSIKELGGEIETVSIEKTKTSSPNGIGADLLIHIHKDKDISEFMEQLNQVENVAFAIRTTY